MRCVMNTSDDICTAAETCREVFDVCVAEPSLGDHLIALRSAKGDFNLWCSAIKATARGKSSLDYRLKNYPDLCEAICTLLAGLAASLHKCKLRATGTYSGQE